MKFETTVKKEDMKEITETSLNFLFKIIKMCTILLIICSTILSLSSIIIEHNYGKALFHIFYCIAFLIATFFVSKFIIKLPIKRINELSQNKGFFEYSYEFKENSINVINHTTSATVDIRYDNIRNWKESAHFFILITKARQTIVINKDEANEKNLQEFLKDKCKKG